MKGFFFLYIFLNQEEEETVTSVPNTFEVYERDSQLIKNSGNFFS